MHSPLFGDVREANDVDRSVLNALLEEVPHLVFGMLNKKLNAMGYVLVLDTKDE